MGSLTLVTATPLFCGRSLFETAAASSHKRKPREFKGRSARGRIARGLGAKERAATAQHK